MRWHETYIHFRSISLGDLGLCFGATLLCLLIISWKWKLFLPQENISTLFKFNMIGQFYSVVLAGQLTGEAAKTFWLGKKTGDIPRVAAAVIIDKLTGFLALLGLAFFGLCLSSQKVPPSAILNLGLLILLGTCFLILISFHFFSNLVERLAIAGKQKMPPLAWFFNFMVRVLESWKLIVAEVPTLLKVFSISFFYQSVGIFSLYILSHSLGLGISYWDWCWIALVLGCALLLPVTVAGIGIRETTLVGILAIFGTEPEKALALSCSLFLVQVILALIGGFIHFHAGVLSEARPK